MWPYVAALVASRGAGPLSCGAHAAHDRRSSGARPVRVQRSLELFALFDSLGAVPGELCGLFDSSGPCAGGFPHSSCGSNGDRGTTGTFAYHGSAFRTAFETAMRPAGTALRTAFRPFGGTPARVRCWSALESFSQHAEHDSGFEQPGHGGTWTGYGFFIAFSLLCSDFSAGRQFARLGSIGERAPDSLSDGGIP